MAAYVSATISMSDGETENEYRSYFKLDEYDESRLGSVIGSCLLARDMSGNQLVGVVIDLVEWLRLCAARIPEDHRDQYDALIEHLKAGSFIQ